MSLDDAVLQRLLKRGERARVNSSKRAIRESFKPLHHEYWNLSLDERDRFHVRMGIAASAGAIALEWARQGGDDRPLDAVRLVDVNKVAQFLQIESLPSELAKAQSVLAPWADRYPRIQDILNAWSVMKQVRSLGPTSAEDFRDALRVLDHAAQSNGEDQIVRAVSVALFRNSKRIEQLERHLDSLTADSLGAPPRHKSEIYALLGLVKEPQPFLVAGAGYLILKDAARCPVVRPYVGIANSALQRYDGSPEWVLTIENLATFYQASKALGGSKRGLIVYTGGMPSPNWCSAYRSLLNSLPLAVPAYHWGDVDEGGFRIAAHIRRVCVQEERQFLPWCMEPVEDGSPATMPDSAYRSMIQTASRLGWTKLAASLRPIRIEQEGLPIRLP